MKGASVKIKLSLFVICSLLIACSSRRYLAADRYLKQNDYQSALGEYIQIAKMGGSLSMSRDIRALTGAMVSYYNLSKYRHSFAISKRILSLDKYNSAAIFYAGMNLVMMNKQVLAKKVFRYYTVLSRFDPYCKFIKAKYNDLVQNEMEKRAQMAIKMEANISQDQIDDNTIAVLYFMNVVEDPEWNSLSKGLAEMMITDLSQIKRLKVLERVYLQKLIEEMQLGMSELADESMVPRMGRLLKAKTLINGTFAVKSDQDLVITSNLIDILSQSDFQSNEFSGALKEIFELEKKIVFATINQMGIQLTADEKRRIGKYATKNFEAFKTYCQGLDAYDIGDYGTAMSCFQQAIKLDPHFILAQNMFEITGALENIEQKRVASMHLEIIGSKVRPGMPTMNLTQYRLNQLSQNLDLGYLPGNDSRNGTSELPQQFWDDNWRNNEPLPAPPTPPTIPPSK